MKEIGLIGLGNIGGGMCRRLLERGIGVVGFDLSPAATKAAAEHGARIEVSPAAVAQQVDVVVTSLPNPAIVRDVYLGEQGLVAQARPGSTLIETSTIDPNTIREVAQAATKSGIRVLDIALSGEPPQAILGELVFQVGGPDELIDQHLELLQVLAKKINRTGGIGTAKTVKLVNNLMSLGNIAVAAEAFVLGVKCGMEPKRLYEILSVSGGRSAHFISGFQKVIEGDYGASFKTSLALKDINLILDLANEEHYAARLAPVIASLYSDAVGRGLGEENFTSVVKGYEATAGIRVAESG